MRPTAEWLGRITDVVNRVGQQRHAAGEDHDHHLQRSGDGKNHEGPLDGPDAAVGRGDARINDAVAVPVPGAAVVMVMPVR